MKELEHCKFAFEVAPGGQSILQYSFDVRRLNLDAVAAAEGQVAQGAAFARRIACTKSDDLCVSYNGMPIDYVEIVSPTAEELGRALGALRQARSVCLQAPAPPH